MVTRLLSWFLRELIYKEKEFNIALDEDIVLRSAATLETKFLLRTGILMLTSKRLAHRSLGTGLHPSWLGGERAALDIQLRDIGGATAGKKRVTPIDPVKQTILTVQVKNRDEPYTFITVNPEIWEQRIDELTGQKSRN